MATHAQHPTCAQCHAAIAYADGELLALTLACTHHVCFPCFTDTCHLLDHDPAHPSLLLPWCPTCHPPPPAPSHAPPPAPTPSPPLATPSSPSHAAGPSHCTPCDDTPHSPTPSHPPPTPLTQHTTRHPRPLPHSPPPSAPPSPPDDLGAPTPLGDGEQNDEEPDSDPEPDEAPHLRLPLPIHPTPPERAAVLDAALLSPSIAAEDVRAVPHPDGSCRWILTAHSPDDPHSTREHPLPPDALPNVAAHAPLASFLPPLPPQCDAFAHHLARSDPTALTAGIFHWHNTWSTQGPHGPPLPQGHPHLPPPAPGYLGPLFQHISFPPHAAAARAVGDGAHADSEDEESTDTAPPPAALAPAQQPAPQPAIPPPTHPMAPIPHTAPPDKPYRCLLASCPAHPFSARTPGDLKEHLRLQHAPLSRLPHAAIADTPLRQCPHCHQLLTSDRRLHNHINTMHPHLPQPPSLPPGLQAPPPPPHAPPPPRRAPPLPDPTSLPPATCALSSNLQFLASLPLDSLELHHVHGNTPPTLPASAASAYDSILSATLRAAVAHPNDDGPAILVYALPRLLLAPPPPSSARTAYPDLIRKRAADLRRGGAAHLWSTFPWDEATAARASPHLRVLDDSNLTEHLNRTISRISPSAAFKSLTAAPFLPPSASLLPLYQAKVHTTPHPSLDPARPDSLPAIASLPPAPFPSQARRLEPSQTNQERTQVWTRRLSSKPRGAPDGTGLTTAVLLLCLSSLAPLAAWLDMLSLGLITPPHRRLLCTLTLGGQVKPCKATGRYPTTVPAVEAIRPLSRPNVVRRHIARAIARPVTRHRRPLLESLGQYGNSPDGCPAAARRLQLQLDETYRSNRTTQHDAHLPLDIRNAHTTISRTAVRARLAALAARPDSDANDTLTLLFFDLFYSIPTTCIIVTERAHDTLITIEQHAGLNQGCGIAGYAYNITATHAIHTALHHFPLTSSTSVHDDTTLCGPIVVTRAELAAHTVGDGPHRPFSPAPAHPTSAHDPSIIPYLAHSLRAVASALAAIDLSVELSKTHLLHLPSRIQPSLSTIMLPHFPTGTTIEHSHCVVGGAPFGSDDGILAFLDQLATSYEALLHRLSSVRDLDAHGGTLILLLCLRPCVRFNHHLRCVPPSLSSRIAHRLRDASVRALARILSIDAALILDAPAASATLLQTLTPAPCGGLGLVDPLTVGPPAFLSSLADSLPTLLTDPSLIPLLTATHLWPTSHSRTLRDAAHALSVFASMPQLYTSLPHSPPPDPAQQSALTHLIDPTTGRPSLARLHLTAQRHLQRPLIRIMHEHVAAARPPHGPDQLIHPPGPATSALLARARLTQCAAYGASALLLAYDIPRHIHVPPAAFVAWISHRLGLPWPGIPPARLRRCAPTCKVVTAHRPIDANPPLAYTAPFALHHMSCQLYGLRIKKHDLWLATLATGVSRIIGPHTRCALTKSLAADDATRKEIDAVIADDAGPHPTLTLDAWLVNALLPTYLHPAARDPHTLFLSLARIKHGKHAEGCLRLHKPFLAVIVNSMGGIGPERSSPHTEGPPTERSLTCVTWVRRSFANAVARERERGHTGSEARRAADHLLQHLNSILAKQQHHAVTRLTRDDV